VSKFGKRGGIGLSEINFDYQIVVSAALLLKEHMTGQGSLEVQS